MIPLTRLNGEGFFLNFDLIEAIEACPDTLITLTTGKHLLVQETPSEITNRVIALRRYLLGNDLRPRFLNIEITADENDSLTQEDPSHG
jgi:flagellar protein FlbD